MSFQILKEVRDSLCSDTNITSKVEERNIRVGWQESLVAFPSVHITTVVERDKGLLGFAHNNRRAVETTIQIDVLSRESLQEAVEIGDAITSRMLQLGYQKVGDLETYDTLIRCHRKTLRFTRLIYVE